MLNLNQQQYFFNKVLIFNLLKNEIYKGVLF